MSNFYDLVTFTSSDRYHFSNESHSQGGAGADKEHSYSFGSPQDNSESSVPRAPTCAQPMRNKEETLSSPEPAVPPVLSPPRASLTSPPRSNVLSSGVVLPRKTDATNRRASTTAVATAAAAATHAPDAGVLAKPPPGPAPLRNVRAQSLDTRNASPAVAASSSSSPPSSSSAHVESKLVWLPHLSGGTGGHSTTATPLASRRASMDRQDVVLSPSAAAKVSLHTGEDGAGVSGLAAKRPFAVPPLQVHSLEGNSAGASAARRASSSSSTLDDKTAVRGGSSATGEDSPGAAVSEPQPVPVWLAKVNSHLRTQPLPRVSTDPLSTGFNGEPVAEAVRSGSPTSSTAGDSDWLNPTTRPMAVPKPRAVVAAARPASQSTVAAIGGGGGGGGGIHTAQPVVSSSSSVAGMGAGAAPSLTPAVAPSTPMCQVGRAGRHLPPSGSFENSAYRRFSSSSRRPSGADTPHMGLAALHSGSTSSTDPSDNADSLSMDRDLSRLGTSTVHSDKNSFNDGFVSIQHTQRHMTASSQRGGGSQYWSGDSHESGASVANGHRQLPGARRPGSDVWSGSETVLRPPPRQSVPTSQTAASMPSRPAGTGTDKDAFHEGHDTVAPARFPRENNFFNAVLQQQRMGRDGVRVTSGGDVRHAAGTSGRVQPLSLQRRASHDDDDEEDATAIGENSFTDLSSKASGISLSAETTYVAQ